MKIPKKWQEITLGQYQELVTIESESPIDLAVQRISILADIDSQEVRNLELELFYELLEDMKFLNTQVDVEWKKTFEFKGKKYGFIPDLNYITTGEWLDADAWKNESNLNLHNYAAMLWRPIVAEWEDGYKIEPHSPEGFAQRAQTFKELPLTYIQGGLVFFLTFNSSYISSIISSPHLNPEMIETPKKKTRQKATKKSRKENS